MNDQENIRRINLRNSRSTLLHNKLSSKRPDIKRDSDYYSDWLDEQAEQNPEMLFLEPRESFDKCCMGTVSRINLNVLCYSVREILIMLQSDMGMDFDEALEHYEYNILGSMSANSPVFLNNN